MVLVVKNLPVQEIKRLEFNPWVRKIPRRRARQSIAVFLPGEFMDRGAWQPTVHRVTNGQTRQKQLSILKLGNIGKIQKA